MNRERISSVVADLESISSEAHAAFGGLTVEQLNWKSSEKSWSVAQCLDHLIRINSFYFPIFEKMRSPDVVNSLWEKISPFSGFFARYLINAQGPEKPRKMTTPEKSRPSATAIGGDIVQRFQEHQLELGRRISEISGEIDLATIITSPLMGFVTYSLGDSLTLLVAHERRHLRQAKQVLELFRVTSDE